MPKNRAMALKPPAITRVQGKSSFCMGAPPVPGKAVTTGNFVAVGGTGVAVGAVAVGVAADSHEIAGCHCFAWHGWCTHTKRRFSLDSGDCRWLQRHSSVLRHSSLSQHLSAESITLLFYERRECLLTAARSVAS